MGERKREEKMKGQYVVIAVLAMVTVIETPSWAKNKSLGVGRDETLMPSVSPSGSLERDIKKKQVLEQDSGIAAAPVRQRKAGTKTPTRRTPAKPTQSAPKNLQVESDEGVNLSSVTVKPLTSNQTEVFIQGTSDTSEKLPLAVPIIGRSETSHKGEKGKTIIDSETWYRVDDNGKVRSISQLDHYPMAAH